MIARIILLAGILCVMPASPVLSQQRHLPDDSQQYQLIVLTQAVPTVQCERLRATIRSAEMHSIVRACKVFPFDPTNDLYRHRYAASVPPSAAPAVLLARPDGGVIYRASGAGIPGPAAMAQAMRAAATADMAVRVGPIRYTFADEAAVNQLLRRPGITIQPTVAPTIAIPGLALGIAVAAVGLFLAAIFYVISR